MPIQLRLYTINRGARAEFATEWNAKVRPLREKLSFRVLGAWTIPATNQFLWLLGYDGPEDWETKDKAYYSSDERRSMQPDPARHIARVEHYFIEPVEG
jgi:hypothetical protein